MNELKVREKEEEYKEKLRSKYKVIKERESLDVEEEWKVFKEEVCGIKKLGCKMTTGWEWWNDCIKILVEKKEITRSRVANQRVGSV